MPKVNLDEVLTDRRIKSEHSKTIQESQFEPYKATFGVEATVIEGVPLDDAAKALQEFVQQKVIEDINSWAGVVEE